MNGGITGFAQQQDHEQLLPLKSQKVTVDKFSWTFNDSSKRADVILTITNHTGLNLKKVSISLTGQDKNRIMLQSGTHTIRQRSSEVTIAPQETKEILFKGAYNNEKIDNLQLNQAVFEFSNGSLETLR